MAVKYVLSKVMNREEGDLFVASAKDDPTFYYTKPDWDKPIADISSDDYSTPIAKLVFDGSKYKLYVKPEVMKEQVYADLVNIHRGRKRKETTGSLSQRTKDFYTPPIHEIPAREEPQRTVAFPQKKLLREYKVPFVVSSGKKYYPGSAVGKVLRELAAIGGFEHRDLGNTQIIKYRGKTRGIFTHAGKGYFISAGDFDLQSLSDILRPASRADNELFGRVRSVPEKARYVNEKYPTDKLERLLHKLEVRDISPRIMTQRTGRKTDLYWKDYETPIETYKKLGITGKNSRNTRGVCPPSFLEQLEEDSRPRKMTINRVLDARKSFRREPEEVFPDEIEIQRGMMDSLYRELEDSDYLLVTRRRNETNIRKPNGGLAAAILDGKLVMSDSREKSKLMRIAVKYARDEEDLAA